MRASQQSVYSWYAANQLNTVVALTAPGAACNQILKGTYGRLDDSPLVLAAKTRSELLLLR